MAVKKKRPSVLKRQRQEQTKKMRNRAIKSRIKTLAKRVKKLILDGKDYTPVLKTTIKQIDMAASKGVIHKNTAARKKSRLIKTVHKLTTDIKQV
ncbi:MAG TPA: 30S ribosomal protein S20 [Candidatus Ratteibacteria bacterium]|jgi:small subunit ribosomal protein S20|uniref:Small ribosomal subunit protein bS20 n=1 Tax=candidate division TA06 bacterium ADurb.Bin131 TaxID=1852827 RepID=A0A1V6CD66_UNCT6|nr:MAG: 30S ribosomal protein S20 [candidate division TA06 bacterium ADurb.Bin131]HOC02951.1 30S ribosomal protein S20 [bacterium]HRS06703.1 30S ribosomal protein S20 [Candidatus Ratteibacteria bacterium]HON06135.1 30S ribosomal protein S20 [bacterium]HOQ81580.1 30S ribosomal protein S20 [bacterium]